MTSALSDLDELVLKCRHKKSQMLISESVICYKSGAFRSCIVSTWIAVVFDIIDKLQDLKLSGDPEADSHLKAFDDARSRKDFAASMKLEKDILNIAKDKFELISNLEYIDLCRLQEDRNRCAHPSITMDEEPFHPSAEQARVHIRSAIEYLLQYPASQGKAALQNLISLIESDFFPSYKEKAIIQLEHSPLRKARKSLVKNFIIVLLKKFLSDSMDTKEGKIIAALNSVRSMHKNIYDELMKQKLPDLLHTLDDKQFQKIITIIMRVDGCWDFLDQSIKQKISMYVRSLPIEKIDQLDFFISHVDLSKDAKLKVTFLTREELANAFFWETPKEVLEKMVELYVSSQSFEQANLLSEPIEKDAAHFTKEQIKKIAYAYKDNSQVHHSHTAKRIIRTLKEKSEFSDDIDGWTEE